ncbi:MAG: hypothetical protein GF334_08970 [Candidatus Altiarchaeales archaeon]|nr:hypothetical protein [Candidatus Altiarchaeales archaeon]
MSRNRTRAAQFIDSLTIVGSRAIARQELGPNAMGCDYCFPHGYECVNSTARNRSKYVRKNAWERRRDIARKYARIRKEQQADQYRAYLVELTATQDWLDDYLARDRASQNHWIELNPEFSPEYCEYYEEPEDTYGWYPEFSPEYCEYYEEPEDTYEWYPEVCSNILMTRKETYPEAFSPRLNEVMVYKEGQPVYWFQEDTLYPTEADHEDSDQESAVLEVICIKGVEVEI